MSNQFLIGDTHFGHRNILVYEPEKRSFQSIEEHDQVLYDNWNRVVGKRDIVWHLGDVCFGGQQINTKLLSGLKGDKRLILGNHDKAERLSPYFKIYAYRRIGEAILSHIPVHPNQLEHRFKFNIHGHTHSRNINDFRYMNVSVEQINLTPILLEDVYNKDII